MKVFNVERRPKGRMLARWLGVFIGLVCFAVILPGDRDRGCGESVTTLSHGGTKRVPELVSESNPPSTVTTLGRTPIVTESPVSLPCQPSGIKDSVGIGPSASQDQESLWEAFSEARHAVVGLTAAEAGMEGNSGVRYFVQNPGEKICARFLEDSVAISSGYHDEEWRVSFRSLNLPAVEGLGARGNRVEYQRGVMTEWFENRPEGIEHGYVIRESFSVGNELRIDVGVEGMVCTNGPEGSVTLQDESGMPILAYSKLVVWDATGRHLPARMEPSQAGIAIFVGVEGARYPVTVDPLITSLTQKIGPEVTGAGQEDDAFGISVAIEGNLALIGAGEADTLRGSRSGIVYVFQRSANVWSQAATLLGSNTFGNHRFGSAVDLDGDRAIVGAWNANQRGAAYVFLRSGTTWTQEKHLTASSPTSSERYGSAVAMSGNHAVVGASSNSAAGSLAGKAYIYERVAGNWSEQAVLAPDDLVALDQFGMSVSVEAGTVVVGARRGDAFGVDAGSAYVYGLSGSEWNLQAELGPSDGGIGDFFGSAVSISGDRIIIGSPQDDNLGNDSGSAYVFRRVGSGWTQEARLVGADTETGDRFGSAVVLDGTRALVGAPWADEPANLGGSAYVFDWSGSAWLQKGKMVGSAVGGASFFGTSVALYGSTALIGAGSETGASMGVQGSAYVFEPAQGSWFETARISLSGDSGAGDRFGISLAMDDDTAVIGASEDNTPAGAGAGTAYVMTRTNGTWSNQARLAAADAGANDRFGNSVSISADTAVVGAYLDDVNDTTYDSGSAYVFVRNGGIWSQQAKLLPADIESLDYFGVSVAVDGDRALIGSYWDRSRRGAAYVFARKGSAWTQEVKFSDPAGGSEDNYGWSVALSGSTAMVGAPGADLKGSQSGAVFVHVRSASGQWLQQAVLSAADGTAFARFGHSLSFDGERVMIGGKNDAYLFTGPGPQWNEQIKFVAGDIVTAFGAGRTVALDGNVAVLGAPDDVLTGSHTRSGSVYLFEENNGIWSQPVKLRSSNPGFLYNFGAALFLDEDTLLVGAPGEDGLSLTGSPADSQGRVYVYRLESVESRISLRAEVLASPLVAGGSAADAFRFTVTNMGELYASGIVLEPEHALPPGIDIVSAMATSGFLSVGLWQLNLPTGESATLTLTLRAGPTAASESFSYSMGLINVSPPDVTLADNQASATISVIAAASTQLEVASLPTLERQTGLLIGKVRISNHNADAIPAFRLYVGGLPLGGTLRNAAGNGGANSLPYLLYNQPLGPGQSVELYVEIHVPDRSTDFSPVYEIELLPKVETLPTAGERGAMPARILPIQNGAIMVEFPTVPGTLYRVEYSPDMSAWKVAGGWITASSNRLQWIDNGPPKTDRHPTEVPTRYYRLAESNSTQ